MQQQQAGNDLLAALDSLVSGWSSPDDQRKDPILERGTDHVPMVVPMKSSAESTPSNAFGTIGTLERKKIGDTTRDDDTTTPDNDPSDEIPDSKLDSSENHVPMFQLFQNTQKAVLDQRLNHWNNHWNEPVPTFQNDVPTPVRTGEPWSNLPPSSACRVAGEWRQWMGDRLRRKLQSGHYEDRNNAVTAVWNEALHVWHMAYGEPSPYGRCGACGEPLTRRDRVITIIDRTDVHASPACLNGYGERCREQARAALVGIGLKPPPDPT